MIKAGTFRLNTFDSDIEKKIATLAWRPQACCPSDVVQVSYAFDGERCWRRIVDNAGVVEYAISRRSFLVWWPDQDKGPPILTSEKIEFGANVSRPWRELRKSDAYDNDSHWG